MEYTTPPSYGSTVVNVGGVVKDGEILYAGVNNTAKILETKTDPESKWPEPKAIRFTWDGKTNDKSYFHAELETVIEKRLDRIDIMSEVPGFIKSFVGSVAGTKPYIYQVRVLHVFPLVNITNSDSTPPKISPPSRSKKARRRPPNKAQCFPRLPLYLRQMI
jgi:hypothetical protein